VVAGEVAFGAVVPQSIPAAGPGVASRQAKGLRQPLGNGQVAVGAAQLESADKLVAADVEALVAEDGHELLR
jgi:hypothetical protein